MKTIKDERYIRGDKQHPCNKCVANVGCIFVKYPNGVRSQCPCKEKYEETIVNKCYLSKDGGKLETKRYTITFTSGEVRKIDALSPQQAIILAQAKEITAGRSYSLGDIKDENGLMVW